MKQVLRTILILFILLSVGLNAASHAFDGLFVALSTMFGWSKEGRGVFDEAVGLLGSLGGIAALMFNTPKMIRSLLSTLNLADLTNADKIDAAVDAAKSVGVDPAAITQARTAATVKLVNKIASLDPAPTATPPPDPPPIENPAASGSIIEPAPPVNPKP